VQLLLIVILICNNKVRLNGAYLYYSCDNSTNSALTACTSNCVFNPLTPKDLYSGRTAPLTSKRFILCIYSTNTDTEYFKHGIYCPFFSLQNAVCFIILTYLVPVLFTFYIQCAKI